MAITPLLRLPLGSRVRQLVLRAWGGAGAQPPFVAHIRSFGCHASFGCLCGCPPCSQPQELGSANLGTIAGAFFASSLRLKPRKPLVVRVAAVW